MSNNPSKASKNIFASSECLTLDQLTAYVENNLPEAERFRVEKHLVDCELCSDAVEGLASSPDLGVERSIIYALSRKIRKQFAQAPALQKTAKLYYAIAAVIIFGIISLLFLFTRNQLHESLFAEYYKPFPNTIPIVRSQDAGNLLQQAMWAYEKRSYTEASKHLQDLLDQEPENVLAHFYLGNALLFLNRPGQAVSHFQKIRYQNNHKLQEHVEWYLGLAYLKLREIERARTIFAEINARNGTYQKQSRELLDRLQP